MRLCAHTQIETESAVKYCRRHRRRRRCHRHYSPRKSATTIRWNSAAAAATLRRARAQKANWIHWIRDSCRRRRSRDHPKVLSNNNNISTRRSAGTKRTQPSATLCIWRRLMSVANTAQHLAPKAQEQSGNNVTRLIHVAWHTNGKQLIFKSRLWEEYNCYWVAVFFIMIICSFFSKILV